MLMQVLQKAKYFQEPGYVKKKKKPRILKQIANHYAVYWLCYWFFSGHHSAGRHLHILSELQFAPAVPKVLITGSVCRLQAQRLDMKCRMYWGTENKIK